MMTSAKPSVRQNVRAMVGYLLVEFLGRSTRQKTLRKISRKVVKNDKRTKFMLPSVHKFCLAMLGTSQQPTRFGEIGSIGPEHISRWAQ
jgi:hypothetical protein